MLLEGFFLSKQVRVVASALAADNSLVFNVPAAHVEGFLTLLEPDLRVSQLDGEVAIAALSELHFLPAFVVLSLLPVTISLEGRIVRDQLVVEVTNAAKLTLCIL